MPEILHSRDEQVPADDSRTISRRRLLKALVASGLAVAGSSLPADWFRPEVDVGVLPAHAQVSPGPHTILRCYADWGDTDGWAIGGGCYISPTTQGIQMRWRISLEAPNHPQDGQEIFSDVGLTDPTGLFEPTWHFVDGLMGEPGVISYTFRITWEFVNLGDGTGTCTNTVTYFVPQ